MREQIGRATKRCHHPLEFLCRATIIKRARSQLQNKQAEDSLTVIEDKTVAVPHENFHAIESSAEEDKEMSIEWVEPPLAPHDGDEPVVTVAAHREFDAKADPDSGESQSECDSEEPRQRQAWLPLDVPNAGDKTPN